MYLMHRFLIILTMIFALALAASGQDPPFRKHKAVLQMNLDAPDSWNQLLGNIRNIQTVFGADNIEIEVVAYGKGINLMVKTNAAFEERLKAAKATGVILAVCQNSMRLRKVKSEDLFPFVTEVDSGVAELIRKQEAGWTYVRTGE